MYQALSLSNLRSSLCQLLHRLMEEDAEVDEDVAKVLKGTDGDPERIRERVS